MWHVQTLQNIENIAEPLSNIHLTKKVVQRSLFVFYLIVCHNNAQSALKLEKMSFEKVVLIVL